MRSNTLYIIIPCYNEEQVLPITGKKFHSKLKALIGSSVISDDSRIVFVDDGSVDRTWSIIQGYVASDKHYSGISLSRNYGHQNALVAGLIETLKYADMTISMDCDGQDDIDVIDEMIEAYNEGSEIVYGIRSDRSKDTFFKRNSARLYYKTLSGMGVNVVENHADFRLMSRRAVEELAKYDEVNLYLRGIIPNLGFRSSVVYYKRSEREAGETHYPLSRMMKLAIDGITSFSIKPIRLITLTGFMFAVLSLILIIYVIVGKLSGNTVSGWTSIMSVVLMTGGLTMISNGIIGEYVGKIYMETKHRPRYAIYHTENLGEDTGHAQK